MNVKKMFASLTGVLMLASMATPLVTGAATYSDELQGAYEYAYSKGITTMSPIDNANMYGELTRGQLSKMISNWAESELGRTADETAVCSFTDTNTAEGDLATYVVKACQMGLMGQGITAFRPNDKVTRGEFGTTLSRAIWGDKYDGANPYYANHLAALSQEGIMTKISEPNNLEIRGWVMLMLQRAATTVAPEECKDAAVVMACALDPESDACPVACRKDSTKTDDETPSDTTVKAGDLQVSVSPATDRRVTTTWVSDLDTITLKASEAITVNSITLERFGYSTYADVYQVWLEDAYGNKIADAKTLSSTKDNVTLKIKKEYREITESDAITIVLETKWAKKGTIGFKVTDVDSSAKNLDLANYNPYTYEIVDYDASAVTVSVKGNEKTYNYEEGTFYEVSRLKIKAGTGAVSINGLTLTNEGNVSFTWALPCTTKAGYTATTWTSECTYSKTLSVFDLDEFVKDVKVTADGKEVNGLKFRATKDNELVMSWDEIEVAINKDVQIVVSIALENFDEFQKYVRLDLKDTWDLNAIEKKTGARVTVSAPDAKSPSWKEYKFAGSKIKFTNTKLSSTIDAAQGAEDVVIAKGNVTVGEEIRINDLVIVASATGVVDAMTIKLGGDSYDASVNSTKDVFTFKNVSIEKSGDVEISVDIVDEDSISGKEVTFKVGKNSSASATSITKALFANNARYIDSREDVVEADVSGSVSISKVKVQESKATLKNTLSSTNVEFPKNETNRKTVFEGTYTAKKSDIYLNEFAVVDQNTTARAIDSNNELTFYVSIDGTEVGDIDKNDINHWTASTGFDKYEDFSEVLVEAGKSVKVKVEVEASVDADTGTKYDYYLYLRGDDKNGTDAGFAKAAMNSIKFVINGSINVSDSTTLARKTVALSSNEVTLAKFTLKPSKASSTVTLDNLVLNVPAAAGIPDENIIVDVDGNELDILEADAGQWNNIWTATGTTFTWNIKFDWEGIEIDEDWVEVEVKVRDYNPTYASGATLGSGNALEITVLSVNGTLKNNKYSRLILPAIVTFERQVSDGSFTTFTIWVDSDNNETVKNLAFFTTKTTSVPAQPFSSENTSGFINDTVTDWATFDVANSKDAQTVKTVYFEIDGTDWSGNPATFKVLLQDGDFNDFFKVKDDGKTLRVFQTKDS